MKLPKPTTRTLMTWVSGLALILGLGLPAYRAKMNPELHTHTYFNYQTVPVINPRLQPVYQMQSIPIPFASRYWHHLSGRARPERRDCGVSLGFIEEVCCLGHPEILPVPYEFPWYHKLTPAQQAERDRVRPR